MHIFLQGNSGIGKSSLLREAFSPCAELFAGFVTQSLVLDGSCIAFRAACVEGSFPPLEARYAPDLEDVFILRHKWWDISVLEKTILQVKSNLESSNAKMIILDEIGGLELTSPVFMSTLEHILSSGAICFGVFKTRENLARATERLKVADRQPDLHAALEKKILACGRIITVDESNRESTLKLLKQAADSIANSNKKDGY